jgi:hypothetical protein
MVSCIDDDEVSGVVNRHTGRIKKLPALSAGSAEPLHLEFGPLHLEAARGLLRVAGLQLKFRAFEASLTSLLVRSVGE